MFFFFFILILNALLDIKLFYDRLFTRNKISLPKETKKKKQQKIVISRKSDRCRKKLKNLRAYKNRKSTNKIPNV